MSLPWKFDPLGVSGAPVSVYGVEYDPSSSSPACQRIILRGGTAQNVASFDRLPAHHFKRCVMDDLATRHINYYLDPLDSTKKLNGAAADLTGADGDVMVEIPIVHWKVETLTNGHIRWLVSDHAFAGSEIHPFFYVSPDGQTARTQYVGAYDATICDANGDRIANMMNEAATSSTAYNAAYKLRSVAGCKPFTSTTLGRLRTTARNNGGEVCNSLFYQFLGLMMLIEGASLNTQATISEGFAYATTWSFAYLRLAGRVNAGNGTAEALADATQDAAITWQVNHAKHVIAFQYRGIENPYGAASQFEEGIQKWDDGSSNPSTACYWWTAATNNYTDTDQNAASSPTYTKTLHAWPRANGVVQTFDPRSFLPLTIGASASTYMCDGYGYDNATGSRILLRGGATGNTTNAGAWYVYAAYALNSGVFGVNGARISA